MSEVVIVGAGLAGLCCALRLQEAGVDFRLVEAAAEVGGRVRTESSGGFRFDCGFQVFLTSYPEARRVLDFGALDLRYFEPGSLVFRDGRFHRFVDPWRRPRSLLDGLFSPVGSAADKLRLARLRRRVSRARPERLLAAPETTTAAALAREGFGEAMVERFFRPFLGGVFLDPALETSSRKFEWVFRMFATGRAALPAGGMARIPEQLASRLPAERILLRAPVRAVKPGCVSLQDGRDLLCSQVVVATDPGTAARLIDGLPAPRFRSTVNLVYSLAEAPVRGPWLILNGRGRGLVNNLVFPSEVSELYAVRGTALASVTVLGNPALEDRSLDERVREELVEWFGMCVGDWRLERLFRLEEALPDQPVGSIGGSGRGPRLHDWLVVAGDWRGIASINGAMESGRLAADAVLEREPG